MNQDPTIILTANQHMLQLLLESVKEKHDRWSGGDPEEQECLRALQQILFAASLELLMDQ